MSKKNFLQGLGIGLMSIASIEVINKAINENAKRYKIKYEDGYYYTWKEGSIHYNEKGEGTPILLVHDLNVITSSHEWSKIEDELAKNHKVYSLDLLGCGLSDKPGITYTNFTFVQLLSDFCKDIIKEKCDVIASNDSSTIVIMANHLNQVFNKTILINPASFDIFALETTRLDLIEKKILFLPVIGTALYNYYTRESNIKSVLSSYFKSDSNIQESIDAYYESSHINNSKGKFLYACKKCSYLTCDVRLPLSDKKDIYILTGSEVGRAISNNYEEVNPNIKITTVDNSKLLPHYENPKDTLEAINKIL